MDIIRDYNNDGKMNYKDYIFYGLTLVGNIIFTIVNIIH